MDRQKSATDMKLIPAGRAIFRHASIFIVSMILLLIIFSCSPHVKDEPHVFVFPEGYLHEPDEIPVFWKSTLDEVYEYLDTYVKRGKVLEIGRSAGGRPIRAVFYGEPRKGAGTSTFSGALGYGDVRAYRGPDHDKTVYLGLSAVHGGEFEGIVGSVNLISILETGKDLRGNVWPEITAAARQLDRLILIPIVNPDGRVRIPIRMESYWGDDFNIHEYLNTGGHADGTIIGWPHVKEFIPMDFKDFGFPGGYPNDAGVNIMHDDFFGDRQPETQALFDLLASEKPDLVINMHTGAPPGNYFMRMHRPYAEPALEHVFESLYVKVHTGLALNGLQGTSDPAIEADVSVVSGGLSYNLDAAINLHCGALSVVVESPSHSFSGTNRAGELVLHTPGMILDAQLVCHQEAMKYLAESGGRSKWSTGRARRN
jgi:hypothetical protein